MSRTSKASWLALLMNVAGLVGALIYGVGNVPITDLKESLKWFALGLLLALIALSFSYLLGMNRPGEGSNLETASPRGVRMLLGLYSTGLLAAAVFIKGVVTMYPLFVS